MPSIKEQIKSLMAPTPVDFDPEDEEHARVQNNESDVSNSDAENDLEKAKEHYIEVGKSKLRNDDLEVDEARYKGAKVDRSNLYEQSEASSNEEEEIEGMEDQDESQSESEPAISFEEEDDEEEYNEESDDSQLEDDEDERRQQLKNLMRAEQKKILNHISVAAKEDATKGAAVQQQMNIFESILEARIHVQRAIQVANTIPVKQTVDYDADTETYDSTLETVFEFVEKISKLRLDLMKSDQVVNEDFSVNKSKKRTLQSAFGSVEELDKPLVSYRESVLSKWSRKIQSSSGSSALQAAKFGSLNQSATIQVSTTLADMDRLIKRTRINRSECDVMGDKEESEDEEQEAVQDMRQARLKENKYIFDDTDFYKLLLKDLVDKKMADSANSSAGGLKWTVVQNKATKKHNRDRKASKGRKLRYNIQEKVQGFAAPRQVLEWTDEQMDDLFSSLFGQKIKVNEAEHIEMSEEEDLDAGGLRLFG